MTVPDLPGRVADGESIEAAIAEAHDAFRAWTEVERQARSALPVLKTYGGQSVQCIPRGCTCGCRHTPPSRSNAVEVCA